MSSGCGTCPPIGCGCRCVCSTTEYGFALADDVFVPPSTLTFTATTTTITLPAQTVVPTCPSCLDIAYTGSLAYPYDGEGPGVRVGVTLVVVNGLTPSVVFGPATAAAPQVALVPNTFVPVGVRYVTCQPRGTFTVAVQFTLLSDAPVGEDTITLAFNGLLTIVGKKC